MDVSTKRVRVILAGLVLAAAFGGGVLVAWLGSDGRLGYTEPRGNPSATPSENAGEFPLAPPGSRRAVPGFAFADADGTPLHLTDLKGKVLLVNLWATWCPPCIAEMPDLDALQARLGGKDFQVVAVSLDRGGQTVVRDWFARNHIRALAVYAADPAQFPNGLLPTSLLVDRQGGVAWHGTGIRDWAGAEADAALRALMAEK